MAAEREVATTLRFTERGIEVVDEAGRKLGFLRSQAAEVGKAGAASFSGWQTSAISFNQTLDLVNRGYQAFVNITSAPINAAATVEALQTRLVSLKGSEEAAAISYQNMARIAQTTPFDLKGVVEAGVTVEAFTKQSDSMLKGVTDLAAFMGTSAVEAAGAYGRAFAAGAGAADILRERGVLNLVRDFKKIDDLTKISLPEFRKALFETMVDPAGPIAGSTDRLAKTWQGLTSNVGDALFNLQASLGNVVIKSEAVREIAERVKGGIDELTTEVDGWARANRDVVNSGLTEFFEEIERIGRVVLPIMQAMADAAQLIRTVGDGIGVAAATFVVDPTDVPNRGARDRIEARRAEIDALRAAATKYEPPLIESGGFTSFFGDERAIGAQSDVPFVTFGPAVTDTPDYGTGGKADASATARAAAQKLFDQQSQAAAQGLNDLIAQRIAMLDRDNTLREAQVKYAEQDLKIAESRGASESELLDLARKVDAARLSAMEQQRASLEAQRDGMNDLANLGLDQATAMIKVETELDLINQQIERQRAGVGSVTEEYVRQRDVVINLGEAANDAQRRVVDGILSGGGNFDLSDIARDTVRTIATDLVGGLIEANSKGGDLVVEGWGESMRGVTGIFRGAFENIIAGAGQFTSTLAGLFGTAGTGAGGLSSVGTAVGTDASGATIFQDQFGNQSLGNAGAGVAAGGGAAGGGFGGAAGAALGIIGVVQIAADEIRAQREGLRNAQALQWQRGTSAGDFNAEFGGAGIAGGIWTGIFGDKLGGRISTSLLTGTGSLLLEQLGISPFGQQKTSGTITKREAGRFLRDTGIPQNTIADSADGREGVRTKYFELPLTQEYLDRLHAAGFDRYGGTFESKDQRDFGEVFRGEPTDTQKILANARPGVLELNTTAGLGLSAVLGANEQEIFNWTSVLTNNFGALGVSEEEARRSLLRLADAAGVTLVGGLDELNKKYLEGDLTQQQLLSSSAGLVDLFSKDLPAGVDLAAIAVANFAEQGGLEVGAFTEAAERAITIFSRLQDTTHGGLGAGIQGGIVGAGNVQAVMDSWLHREGATLGDVQRALNEAREQFLEPFVTSIYQGVLDAMSAGILDAVKDTPAWDVMEQAIAAAVKGTGDPGAILSLTNDLLTNLGPQLENAAAIAAVIGDRIAVLPSTLRDGADTLQDRAGDVRFGELNRSQQRGSLNTELGDINRQLALNPDDAARRDLLGRRSEIGFGLITLAQQQYAEGTQARASAVGVGIALVEDTAAQLREFADEQSDALTGNTNALGANTAALSRLTSDGITLTIKDGNGDREGDTRRRTDRHDADLDSAFWELFAAATQSERGQRLIRDVQRRP